MDRKTKEWKAAADRLWADAAFDCRAATQLAGEIARCEESALCAVAAQALPSLRASLLKGAERNAGAVARRRFGAVRDVLHSLDAPRFGKRPSVAEVLSQDEQHRRLLGLPVGRRLYGREIHQAYNWAAKTMHPDGGGSERRFHELSAARDALLCGQSPNSGR
jgi:hypothetical protein